MKQTYIDEVKEAEEAQANKETSPRFQKTVYFNYIDKDHHFIDESSITWYGLPRERLLPTTKEASLPSVDLNTVTAPTSTSLLNCRLSPVVL